MGGVTRGGVTRGGVTMGGVTMGGVTMGGVIMGGGAMGGSGGADAKACGCELPMPNKTRSGTRLPRRCVGSGGSAAVWMSSKPPKTRELACKSWMPCMTARFVCALKCTAP